jgi:hypothetical protein
MEWGELGPIYGNNGEVGLIGMEIDQIQNLINSN